MDGSQLSGGTRGNSPVSWSLSQRLLRKISRVTASTQYIAEIDGLRFLAIFGVVIYHLPEALRFAPLPAYAVPWFSSGQLGVQLFFIISGFVLALPFARAAICGGRPIKLRSYYLRRVTRIEPPYLISLLLLFAAQDIFARAAIPHGHLLASMLYMHAFFYHSMNPVNPVAWSLEVEVQFYLLVPLLTTVFALPRRARRGILVIAALALLLANCVYDTLFHGRPDILYWSVLGYLHYFLTGFLFADLYLCKELFSASLVWDGVAPIAAFVIVYGHLNPYSYTGEITSAFGLSAIFAAAFLGRWSRVLFRWRWIAAIGGMCYSIYLLHYFVLRTAGIGVVPFGFLRHGGLIAYSLAAVILFPTILIVCGLFFVLVERPCMDPHWPGKLLRTVQTWRLVASVSESPKAE